MFGRRQNEFVNYQPMTGMPCDGYGMPYDGHGMAMMQGSPQGPYPYDGSPDGMHAAHAQMGYDPCGYCGPYYECVCEFEKPQPQIYVVKKGDTVYKIAKRHGLDWRELAGYNHLGNPDLIYPGERLFIPPRY